MKATFERNLENFPGDARLYRLSEPITYGYAEDGENLPSTNYVVSSALVILGEPETYLFACDGGGKVLSWVELPQSQKRTLDHDKVIRDAGWEGASMKLSYTDPPNEAGEDPNGSE